MSRERSVSRDGCHLLPDFIDDAGRTLWLVRAVRRWRCRGRSSARLQTAEATMVGCRGRTRARLGLGDVQQSRRGLSEPSAPGRRAMRSTMGGQHPGSDAITPAGAVTRRTRRGLRRAPAGQVGEEESKPRPGPVVRPRCSPNRRQLLMAPAPPQGAGSSRLSGTEVLGPQSFEGLAESLILGGDAGRPAGRGRLQRRRASRHGRRGGSVRHRVDLPPFCGRQSEPGLGQRPVRVGVGAVGDGGNRAKPV